MTLTARLEKAIDGTKVGRRATAFAATLRRRMVPTHWTDIFGIVTLACIALLFVTGVALMFFYVPSSDRVVYDGGYAPLHGVEMSRAFASMLALSLDVNGGLFLRQAHHWAALLLPAAILAQLAVMYFTGAFRRPRQASWVLLFLILVAALAGGWSGYALPDDMLSGTGLRIVEGIVLGIPIVGTWIAALLFGGGFPGRIIETLYPIHLLVSVALVVLVALRVRVALRHGVAGYPDAKRMPVLPVAAARWLRLATVVVGVVLVMSATVAVAPIWLYGPSDPGNASAGSQPDWYTGFLDGALRLVPPGWEFEIGGYTLTLAVLVPLAVVGVFLAAVLAYPLLENWVVGRGSSDLPRADLPRADVLDRPRNVPTRTAIGVAGMTFYAVLWGAASADVLATTFSLSLESVVVAFQVSLLVAPLAAFSITRRVCLGLRQKDRDLLAHGIETGRIVRMPGGRYVEIHAPLPAETRRRLLAVRGDAPLKLRPDAHGQITVRARVRSLLSRMLFPVEGSEARAEIESPDVDRNLAA
jgi:ubiquinol-cytochrome c reductase cytochrome b subunit